MHLPVVKKCCYVAQTIFGALLLPIGFNGIHAADVVDILVGYICFTMGSLLMLFGLATYMLRDQPDIWQ